MINKFEESLESISEEILEEGVLKRFGQRVRNLGRNVSHPFNRTFGSDHSHAQAAVTSLSGYKKQKMFRSIIVDAVRDLQKLGVLNSEIPTIEIAEFIMEGIANQPDMYNFDNEKDLSKLGQSIRTLNDNN